MNFDLNETLADMANAIKISLKDNWPEAKSIVNDFLTRRKVRLELIADMRFKGILDDASMNIYLEREKNLLEMELIAIAIISKSMAQKAANAALDILKVAINVVVKTIL